jgi:hypothetical protein
MKRISFALPLVVTVALLTGCGEKPAETPAAPPAASEKKSATATELQKTATQIATEAATEVKKQAQEVFANLSQQLADATKGASTDALLKSIGSDLETRVGKLATSLASNDAVKSQLNTGVQALLGGKDIDAVGALSKLTTAKLTPEQTTLAKDVYNAAAAFVTQKNFSSVAGMNSDVGQLANAVLQGNYTQALQPLQKLYNQATLTPAQKDLLGATFDQYMPAGWKDAAKTVQEGVNTLKKLGL